MEKQSPSDNISPSSVSGHSSTAPTQPTYTTAGTLYNPSSSQPLQPPTRRGRSLKWTSGGVYPDLSLLPRSALVSLHNQNSGRSSPYQVAQYTPLQQNYDRAAHPVVRPDYIDEMPPRWRGSSVSPAVDTDDTLSGYTPSDRDDDDDGEDDEGMNSIMMNMTVKSLHNLASYPNPNQKKAQKALMRPVKPRPSLSTQNGTSTNDFPIPPTARGDTRLSPELVYDRSRARPRPSNSDSISSQLLAKAELHTAAERVKHGWDSLSLSGDSADMGASWLAQLDLGGPRPLTAGPPGQRQYRASTFKSTFKALNTEVQTAKQTDDEDAYAVTARVLQHAGIDDAGGKLESSLSRQETDASDYPQLSQGSQILQSSPKSSSHGIVAASDKETYMGPWGHGERAADGAMAQARPEWGQSVPCAAERSLGHPEYEANLALYMEKMNKVWYMGCETLCHRSGQTHHNKSKEASVGVIGQGRPKHSGSNRHGELKIQEANKMEPSEHAETILEMVLANLSRKIGDYY